MVVKDGMQRFSVSMNDNTVAMLDKIVNASNEADEIKNVTRSQVLAQLVGRDPRSVYGHDDTQQKLNLLNAPIEGMDSANEYKTQIALKEIAQRCSGATAERLAGLFLKARDDRKMSISGHLDGDDYWKDSSKSREVEK